MTAPDVEPPVFNPFDPDFKDHPYPVYQRLLRERPVSDIPMLGMWVFARHADCSALLRDPRSSSDSRNSNLFKQMLAAGTLVEDAEDRIRPFLFLDPPDHTRLRGLVSKAFTPKTIEAWRPRIQELVDGMVDRCAEAGGMEVIGDFAYPLPVVVISEMMGVPAEDHETFQAWSKILAASLDLDFAPDPAVVAERLRASEEFAAYFKGLIDQRRASPGDDLLSRLVAVEEDGDRLSHDELIAILILLLIAGHETTVNLIGNGVLQLLRHPDQLDRLRSDPSLAKPCVEEVLRFDPPVQLTARIATAPVDIAGVTVAEGEQALLLLGAANRDPDAFADPDTFDIGRADNHHLAFGFGAHFCLGAPLARLESQIALSTLMSRVGGRLALVDDVVKYKATLVLRGPEAIPVTC